jgi:hypothetical protein
MTKHKELPSRTRIGTSSCHFEFEVQNHRGIALWRLYIKRDGQVELRACSGETYGVKVTPEDLNSMVFAASELACNSRLAAVTACGGLYTVVKGLNS